MELIVAADRAGGIGKDGSMIYSLPEDLKRFKEITMGKTLVMGKGTFLSLPGQSPLPGRVNCVLSRHADDLQKQFPPGEFGPYFYSSIDKFLAQHDSENVICIGGGEIYRQLIPLCNKAFITEIHDERPADTFFHLQGEWKCIQREPREDFDFCLYIRK